MRLSQITAFGTEISGLAGETRAINHLQIGIAWGACIKWVAALVEMICTSLNNMTNIWFRLGKWFEKGWLSLRTKFNMVLTV